MGSPVPKCPIRWGEPCTLCQSGATGPENCGLVWLVMSDPDLRAQLDELRRHPVDGKPTLALTGGVDGPG